MPPLAKRLTDRALKSRTISVVVLIAATALAGSIAPASAFAEPSPGSAHHHHSPSGANVIGRGIGGMHGRYAAAADQVDEAMAFRGSLQVLRPVDGQLLGYDGRERPCP